MSIKMSVCTLLAAAALCANTPAARADTIVLPVIIRDFTPATNPDFEADGGGETGIVMPTLGPDGRPVYAHGANPTNSVHSQATFDQWYRDVPGTNITIPSSITLDNHQGTPGGGYTYINNEFFPIDGQGFGDYPNSGHNYHFTLEMHTQFTYQPGQVFNFAGDDDVWVYINNQLVIDLGGIHGQQFASLNLDTLGLTDGGIYNFDFFFAERHTIASSLVITTSIIFTPAPGSAALLAIAGLGALRRRR